jgi:tetratricopeptide (TPR) repeat protein
MTASRSSTSPPERGEAAADPDTPDGMLARAKALATAGDYERAVPLYRALVAGQPDRAELWRALGRALRQTGAVDESIACYRRALALDPGDAGAHDELGQILSARGELRDAAEHLRAAVAHDPRLLVARVELGELLFRDGRAPEAAAELRVALELDPTNWGVHYRLGVVLARLGPEQLEEAMSCFRRAIGGMPGHAPAHLQLGLAFWNRGDPAPAIALAERALRLDPKLPAAHGVLGAMLRTVGRTEEAIASLRQAVAANADDATACFHLGVCLCEASSGNLAEGATFLQRAAALTPRNVQAHIQLSHVLVQMGRRDEALAAYRTALTLHPDDPTLQIGATIAELPMLCDDAAEIERCRAGYAAGSTRSRASSPRARPAPTPAPPGRMPRRSARRSRSSSPITAATTATCRRGSAAWCAQSWAPPIRNGRTRRRWRRRRPASRSGSRSSPASSSDIRC